MERDWKKINSRLVRQGTLLISLSFLDNWEKQVKELNSGKVGRPFKYPTGLIEYGGLLHCFMRLGYRQVKGIFIAISEKEPRLKVSDYCTLSRRFNKLETKIHPKKSKQDTGDFFIAVDSSGMSVTNRGEWMRKIHRKGKITECKGFVKIHVAIDVKTKEIVCLEVTKEDVGDNTKFDDLLKGSIENTYKKIDGIYADGGYDTYENFEKLENLGIEPIIRIDDNAITIPPPDNFIQRKRGEPARRKYARQQLSDRDKWKKDTKYGERWFVETFFSTLKRKFGTYVMAKKWENMPQELHFKTQLYNQLL